jgi:hypothetical protein
MKKLIFILCCITFFSCKNENVTGKFTVTGEIKNAEDQKIFLEEVHFSQTAPQVIDTSILEKGKVNLKAIGEEEGLYRIRLEKGPAYIFIHDKDAISFTADAADQGYKSQNFNSPANASLKKFINTLDSLQGLMHAGENGITALIGAKANDSLIQVSKNGLAQITSQYNDFILKYIDTTATGYNYKNG